MRYTLLGNSGLRVSAVALGTMTFGMDWGWGQVSAESWVKCACAAMAGASGHGQQRWIVHPRHLVALRPARECGPWGRRMAMAATR